MPKKNDLRLVEVNIASNYQVWIDKGIGRGIHKGKFHGFFQVGNDEGMDCIATIEMENGEVITIDAERVRFID